MKVSCRPPALAATPPLALSPLPGGQSCSSLALLRPPGKGDSASGGIAARAGGLILLCALLFTSLSFAAPPHSPLTAAGRPRAPAPALILPDLHAHVTSAAPHRTREVDWAVHRKEADMVARLTNAGANVNAKNEYGATALSEAAPDGATPLVEKLLNAGANPNTPNVDGQTP